MLIVNHTVLYTHLRFDKRVYLMLSVLITKNKIKRARRKIIIGGNSGILVINRRFQGS